MHDSPWGLCINAHGFIIHIHCPLDDMHRPPRTLKKSWHSNRTLFIFGKQLVSHPNTGYLVPIHTSHADLRYLSLNVTLWINLWRYPHRNIWYLPIRIALHGYCKLFTVPTNCLQHCSSLSKQSYKRWSSSFQWKLVLFNQIEGRMSLHCQILS